MRLLIGHDEAVASWVGSKLGHPLCPPYTALGWIDDNGTLRIGFVFHRYIPNGNIEIDVASTAGWTRGVLRTVCAYAFNGLGVQRMTAVTRLDNKRVRSILERAGFRFECVMRQFYGPQGDAMQFRMFKSDAKRWL